jgi:hypothetical protein
MPILSAAGLKQIDDPPAFQALVASMRVLRRLRVSVLPGLAGCSSALMRTRLIGSLLRRDGKSEAVKS